MASRSLFHVCIIGSLDFVRRMGSIVRQETQTGKVPQLTFSTAGLGEARSVILTERPQILVVDVGLKTSRREITWLRDLLSQIRNRYEKNIYIILAITASEKFVYGGDLIFQDSESLEPSRLIDNLIIAPPPHTPLSSSLEDQLCACLTDVIEATRALKRNDFPFPALWEDGWVPVMCDPESRDIWMRWLPRYARYVNENPVIVGPSGSGKTRLAAALHKLSGLSGPFIGITPRDFSSPELVQAELFGAVAGAYTGAVEKWGLVRKAEKGTLFIDELQSIDQDLQGKLITFIENKTYRRVGEAESHQADVRFVFATNRPLQDLVDCGNLRDDFAYRLERLQIVLSPLQKRRLDIAAGICFSLAKVLRERAKAQRFVSKDSSGRPHVETFTPKEQLALEGLSSAAYRQLYCASWPGNLRQVENTIAKLIELADMKKLRVIDVECTSKALSGLLGQKEWDATDVFERAAIRIALQARSTGYESISECVSGLNDGIRLEAFDACAGDLKKAAELIHDSTKIMELFAAMRSTGA